MFNWNARTSGAVPSLAELGGGAPAAKRLRPLR